MIHQKLCSIPGKFASQDLKSEAKQQEEDDLVQGTYKGLLSYFELIIGSHCTSLIGLG